MTRPPIQIDFIVPGFSKCGTTTLTELLSRHPQLFMPTGRELKEFCFFPKENYETYWAGYAKRFQDARPGALLGECSTCYTDFHFERISRERMLYHYPEIKLIFIARDPLDRVESAYREIHHNGHLYKGAPYSLDRAVRIHESIVENAFYWRRIRNYLDHMDERRMHVVFLEHLAADPQTVLKRCFDFLRVDSDVEIPECDIRLNDGRKKLYDSQRMRLFRRRGMFPQIAQALDKIPSDDIDPLLEELGLRRAFGDAPLNWEGESLARTALALKEDAKLFLDKFRPHSGIWPRTLRMGESEHAAETGEPAPVAGVSLDSSSDNNRVICESGRVEGALDVKARGVANTVHIGRNVRTASGTRLEIVGHDNGVEIGDDVVLRSGSRMSIRGSHNKVVIGSRSAGTMDIRIVNTGLRYEIGEDTVLSDGGTFHIVG